MPRFTISLSGPDNIGKSTLLALFPRGWPVEHVGGIHHFDARFSTLMKGDGFFGIGWPADAEQGQFRAGLPHPKVEGAASDEEFVQTVVRACIARHTAVQATHDKANSTASFPGAALDRSGLMFEAVCAARIALVNHIPLSEAETRVTAILKKLGLAFPSETVRIILRRRGSLDDAVKWTLDEQARFHTVTAPYPVYQRLLHEALYRQIEAGRYTDVIERDHEETFLATLAKITDAMRARSERPAVFHPLLEHLHCCPAFGGLSECGKSTTATEVVNRGFAISQGGAFRMKIGFLLDSASARLGRRVYELPENDQALELVHELDRFSRAHRWLKMISLESIHCYASTRRLRELIGSGVPGLAHPSSPSSVPPKYLVVYLDTPVHLRKGRTEAEGKSFDPSKDDVKRSRGADKVRDIADLVVQNDGEHGKTCDAVMAVIEATTAWAK